ncbi:DUF3329 domain-containing protein [Vagococcus fluvialis]|uniref:DUF3329 domain-containing protein n=1 Tax=Vagococcus fluvialis TaxID=2738 RepID=UPI001D0A38B1|nr:DUF6056 family protein [Vagococcus fluvialis]UDM73832.1 DUF6056 family protein [Vagococcus fluvialis]
MKNYLKKYSQVINILIIICVGILMYNLNYLTTFRGDDFNYHYSFADGTRISSLLDVFKSQVAHYKVMNGRIPAHFLMQTFTIFGKPVFNIMNTIVYLFFIGLVMYMINRSWKINGLSFFMLFIVMWYYTPAYGQTVLWMDGAFNYLWTAVIVLFALLPFRNPKMYDYKINQFIFPLIGLIAGWSSETISAGLVFFQFWFILYWIYTKRSNVVPYIITMFASFAGYCLMMFSPAQMNRLDSVSGGEINILKNIYEFIIYMSAKYYIEIILFILLLTISILLKRDKEKNYLAILFFATAILSSLTLVAVGILSVNSRAFFGVNTMIIISLSILIKNIFSEYLSQFNKMILVYAIVFIPLFATSYRATYVDMKRTSQEFYKREELISELKAKGEKELDLNAITSTRDHNPYYLTPDLSPNPNHWQNVTKSKYYGVEKINKAN